MCRSQLQQSCVKLTIVQRDSALPPKHWIPNSAMSEDPGLKVLELYMRDGENPINPLLVGNALSGLDNTPSIIN